jgi:hypothetical protein
MTRRTPPTKLPPLPAGLAAVAAIQPGDMAQMNLANLAAVAGLLMQLLDRDHEHCMAFAVGMPWEKAHAKTEACIKALAAALLGQDPAFQHVQGFGRRLRCSRCGGRQVGVTVQPDTRPPELRESDGPRPETRAGLPD